MNWPNGSFLNSLKKVMVSQHPILDNRISQTQIPRIKRGAGKNHRNAKLHEPDLVWRQSKKQRTLEFAEIRKRRSLSKKQRTSEFAEIRRRQSLKSKIDKKFEKDSRGVKKKKAKIGLRELKAECKKLKLATSGTKNILTKRIKEEYARRMLEKIKSDNKFKNMTPAQREWQDSHRVKTSSKQNKDCIL